MASGCGRRRRQTRSPCFGRTWNDGATKKRRPDRRLGCDFRSGAISPLPRFLLPVDDAKIAAKAMALGAAGYVPKTAPKSVLLEAIAEVLKGASYVPAQLASLMRAVQWEIRPRLTSQPALQFDPMRNQSVTACAPGTLQQTNRL